jgi:4-hydroxybenzoyl-CoA reductase subunit beta
MDSLSPTTIARPGSLADACALLAGSPDARLLAGGTDLIVNLRRGIGSPRTLVTLDAIAGLDRIAADADAVSIGAMTTLRTLAADPIVRREFTALAEAAEAVAGPAHRTVATVGGNLCVDTRCVFYNQSRWWREANGGCLKHGGTTCHVAPQGEHCHAAFCGDLAPALIALDASATVASAAGERQLAVADLYADDGRAHLRLAPGEVVAAVRLPRPAAGVASGYRKLRVRGAIDFPLAGVAIALAVDDGRLQALRVALTGTNPRPFELQHAGALLGRRPEEATDDLARLIRKQVAPMRTGTIAANYRRQAVAALASRLLCALAAGEDRPPTQEIRR